MVTLTRMFGLAFSLALPFGLACMSAQAAEIRLLCSNGLREVVHELAPAFERESGHKLVTSFGTAAGLKRQMDAGEPFDLAVLTPALIDDLIREGRVAAATRRVLARSGMGLMIRKGVAKPDITTAESFKQTLLAAKSITYPGEGASGIYFVALMDRLALADTLRPKLKVVANAAAVEVLIENGEAELGVLPISEILPAHGAELIGPFPAELQGHIIMTAGVGTNATQAGAAADFIAYLTTPAALAVIKSKGMEPG